MFSSREKQNHTKAALWVSSDEVPRAVRLMETEIRGTAARFGVGASNETLQAKEKRRSRPGVGFCVWQ